MHRTIHEALELRDLITECETIASKLLHAVATCRDADTCQMLGAHERAFRQHARQLREMLAGGVAMHAPVGGFPQGAMAAYPGPGAAGAAASPGPGYMGPGGPASAPVGYAPGGSPAAGSSPAGYPAARPAGHGFRPMHGGAPDEAAGRERAHGRAHGPGPGNVHAHGPSRSQSPGSRERDRSREGAWQPTGGRPPTLSAGLESGPGETARADRPELVGWEPGAGNNEGWQAGARREDLRRAVADVPRPGIAVGDTRLEAASPLAPRAETFRGDPSSGREPERPAGHRPGHTGAEAFTAVRPPGHPYSFSPQQDNPGFGVDAARVDAGTRSERPGRPGTASPRVDFAPSLQPDLATSPAAYSRDFTGTQGHGSAQQTWRSGVAGGVAITDPDALAVADCLKDCKHVAVRLVMAAGECADHHLRRALYQMAGEHLEMAGQHFEWLRRRHLYNVAVADPNLLGSLQQDIQRLEQAVRVAPAGGPSGSFAGQDFRH